MEHAYFSMREAVNDVTWFREALVLYIRTSATILLDAGLPCEKSVPNLGACGVIVRRAAWADQNYWVKYC